MQWDRRSVLGVSAFSGVLILLAGGGYIATSKGKTEPPPLVPVPVATPAQAIDIPAAGNAPPPTAPTTAPTTVLPTTLKVFVSGAVKTAGVYNLKPGARIEDAIQAAGGFTANAQRDAINLADYARDADQYNIPTVAPKAAPVAPASVHRPTIVHGSMAAVPHPVAAEPSVSKSAKHTETTASVSPSVETVAVTVPGRVLGKAPEIAVSTETAAEVATGQDIETGGVSDTKQKHSTHKGASGKSGGSSSKFKNPGDGIVHLNTATAEELQKLPGVGPSMASRILEYRQQVGKFADISQIQDVKGIGPKKYSKMAAFLDL